MPNIELSVITPCYNAGDLLYELACCISSQARSEVEWIIVDDGSSEYTLRVLDKVTNLFKSSATRLLVSKQQNRGACSARNAGLNVASGRHVTFLDADDLLSYCAFDFYLNETREMKSSALVCQSVRLIDTGSHCHVDFAETNFRFNLLEENAFLYFLAPSTHHSACCFLRSDVLEIDGWDERLLADQDGDFLRRFFFRFDSIRVGKKTVHFWRDHSRTERITGRSSSQKLLSRVESLNKTVICAGGFNLFYDAKIWLQIVSLYRRLLEQSFVYERSVMFHVARQLRRFALGLSVEEFWFDGFDRKPGFLDKLFAFMVLSGIKIYRFFR